jgi:hypothetical protein
MDNCNWDVPLDYSINSNLQAVQAALPRLQQLTHLHLSTVFSRDALLEQLQQLSALRDLRWRSAGCTTASFAAGALPKSLTSLDFKGAVGRFMRTFSPSTVPALTQLTALQELRLAWVATFDAALLDSLTALRLVHVCNCSLGATAGLTALSSLKQLQHLHLPNPSPGAAAASATAEVAALTTSSQLTHLHIDNYLVAPQQYIHLFPEGQPYLQLLTLLPSVTVVMPVGSWAGTRDSTHTRTQGGKTLHALQLYHADARHSDEVCKSETSSSLSPLAPALVPVYRTQAASPASASGTN